MQVVSGLADIHAYILPRCVGIIEWYIYRLTGVQKSYIRREGDFQASCSCSSAVRNIPARRSLLAVARRTCRVSFSYI